MRPFRSGSLGVSLSGDRFEVALVGRHRYISRVAKAHSEALGSDPLSRGAGSTHSSRRRLSWLDTAVTVSPEAIGERGGIVQAIGAEHPGALAMAVRPFLAAQALEGDSLCAR